MSVGEVVDGHRLVVCVGTGGVGKTTLAAAIALGGALRGRRAMVLTIDPAHQLARALGLESLAPQGERVAGSVLAAAGLAPAGTLHAAMLDQRRAWDSFVERHAPDEEVRDGILHNPFYRQLSSSFAGALEYVAIEELCRMVESRDYDLIVLDTPPTGGALDFLRAPERIDRLILDPETLSWLSRPLSQLGRGLGRAAAATATAILRQLARATGTRTLKEVSALFAALADLRGDIGRRTEEARALLRGPATAFVLVAPPDEGALAELGSLAEGLRQMGAPLRALILNRVHPLPEAGPGDPGALHPVLVEAGIDAEAIAWLEEAYAEAVRTAGVEEACWRDLGRATPEPIARARVPELDRDLHRLEDLATVSDHLWKER